MISHDLKTALAETIQAHASRYHYGKVDLESVLSALGELGSDVICEVPDRRARLALYWTLIHGLITALRWKTENRAESFRRQ
jgi:hypothetical protein